MTEYNEEIDIDENTKYETHGELTACGNESCECDCSDECKCDGNCCDDTIDSFGGCIGEMSEDESKDLKMYMKSKIKSDILSKLISIQSNFNFEIVKLLLKEKIPDINDVYVKLNNDIIEEAAKNILEGANGINMAIGSFDLFGVINEVKSELKNIINSKPDETLESFIDKIRKGIHW